MSVSKEYQKKYRRAHRQEIVEYNKKHRQTEGYKRRKAKYEADNNERLSHMAHLRYLKMKKKKAEEISSYVVPLKKTTPIKRHNKERNDELQEQLKEEISKETMFGDIPLIIAYLNKNRDPSKPPFVSAKGKMSDATYKAFMLEKVKMWITENTSIMKDLRRER